MLITIPYFYVNKCCIDKNFKLKSKKFKKVIDI